MGSKSMLVLNYDGADIQFTDDGWFNATVVAQKYGKEPYFWLRQRETVEYVIAVYEIVHGFNSDFVEEFSRIKGLDSTSGASQTKLLALLKKTGLVKTKRGAPETGGGTWLHPKLGVHFARWLDVRFAVWCDTQIEQIIHGNPEKTDWKRVRHAAASSYKVMSSVLLEVRKVLGKETKSFHYANEAKLVNWALCGEYIGLDRESMSVDQLDILARLEELNTVLIAQGVDREARKAKLTELVSDFRLKHQKVLTVEDLF